MGGHNTVSLSKEGYDVSVHVDGEIGEMDQDLNPGTQHYCLVRSQLQCSLNKGVGNTFENIRFVELGQMGSAVRSSLRSIIHDNQVATCGSRDVDQRL